MAKNDLERHLIFEIIIRICEKNFEFCGKTFKFLPKRCVFIFCIFNLNEVGLIHQSHKAKNKRRGTKI